MFVEEQSGGYFVDIIDTPLAKDVGARSTGGTGLVLPADDIASGRIRRAPPPLPPQGVRTERQTDLEVFKAWRAAR
eukprot:6433831-Alexandrium_andersonii.AAC.1